MGYAPLEAIAEFFVGSVSNHVVDHANCAVLVIKDTNPRNLWIVFVMVGLAFAIEIIYRQVTNREIHLNHPCN